MSVFKLFWSVFPGIQTEYGEIHRISPYSVRMRENTDQNNSEYVHFLRSATRSEALQGVSWFTSYVQEELRMILLLSARVSFLLKS